MNINKRETEITKHHATVTDSGTRATCTCGWYSRWAFADGSAYEDAAAHNRCHDMEEA